MDLKKAIEILTHEANTGVYALEPDLKDAQKLGIEALKRIEDNRRNFYPFAFHLLQGETKD